MKVNLTKRINTPTGMRNCPVVLSANGRVKPDMVWLMGQRNGTRKGLTTLNGAKAQSGCVCRLVKMRRMQQREGFAKRQS